MGHYEGRVGAAAERLDRYIAESLGLLSRSQLKSRVTSLNLNGRPAKPSRPVKEGDLLEVSWKEEEASAFEPEAIALSILYEDDFCLAIDKAQGMVVHPAKGNRSGTLANALAWHLGLRDVAGAQAYASFRAGIVHRLDKDTSGVIVAAKDARSQAFLSERFRERSARKEYLAILRGRPDKARGSIETSLARDPADRKRFAVCESGGKRALTEWIVLASSRGYSLVSFRPRTGRTHQLRVHAKALGCPILGDPIYGRKDSRFPGASLMLHAYRLRIALPPGGETRLFRAPLPERFVAVLDVLGIPHEALSASNT